MAKYEVTRTELSVPVGQKGRRPVEWRVNDFLVPKTLLCSQCEKTTITTKDGFVKSLAKSGLSPERYVKKYICRKCRKSMRDNGEPVRIGLIDESAPEIIEIIENIEPSQGIFTTKVRGAYMSGLQIGLIVKHHPVVFYAREVEFEDGGIRNLALKHATEIYELRRGKCFRHPAGAILTDRQIHDGLRKFSKVDDMYNYEDMDVVIAKMLNGGL